nr:MAG TPA: hypothetical protein [Caudoviricetes sp.]
MFFISWRCKQAYLCWARSNLKINDLQNNKIF